MDPKLPFQPTITDERAVTTLKERFDHFFGREVKVSLVDGAVANASASADEIKIKRGAMFSARDLRQIEFHEGQVHMATALNGRAQPRRNDAGWRDRDAGRCERYPPPPPGSPRQAKPRCSTRATSLAPSRQPSCRSPRLSATRTIDLP